MYLNLYGIVDEHFFLCVLFLFLYCLLCLTIYKYSFFFFALILSILHVTDLIVMRVETPEMTNAKEIRYKIHKWIWNRIFYMTLIAEQIFGWFLANCILCFRLSDLMRYLIIYSECVLVWWNVFLFHHITKPIQILSNSIYILNHLRFALLIPRLVTSCSCSYFFCFVLFFLFLLLIILCC